MGELPVLGAAMRLQHLELHGDWLRELPRDLELQDFVTPGLLDEDWSDLAAQIKAKLDGFAGRLGIHGPFFDLGLDAYDPLIRQVVQKRLQQGLDACEAIGATSMVVHSPFSIWDHDNICNYDGMWDAKFETIRANLKDVLARAEAMGCTLVLENIQDLDPRYRLDLVEYLNSPAIALSVDTGHAHYMHRALNAPPVDYFIKSAGNKLEHVHLQDVDGYADRHWNPGEGDIPWQPVFDALSKLESKPRLILEIMDEATLRNGADYLVQLGVAR